MLKARLRRCAELVGNGASLARATGIPRRTLETYLSGIAEPKASRLNRIARAAGVSGHWLLTGVGPERPDDETAVAEFVAIERPAVGQVGDVVTSGGDEAGYSRIAFQRDWLRRNGWTEDALRLVETRGDGMAPTVHDGSLLLVDTSLDDIREEGVYVLEGQDALMVRRIQFDLEGGVIATSDNPAYREQYLQRERAGDLAVFGKVVWVGNPLS
ncbi:XRE family transcriptional regulator [Natronospira bacteriovora]|uniref:S24 family peptidase n=1 Tax=Natronospira bacteriovora TaxID=3069753 RepID=A0ABU0W5X4_9GAMM|nr:LexA family transcriptional regulator [Natronospira sp. AB-CW4]MDQ2069344.1 S24 family peptidase [Natronospira sp. AB-CW4]